MDDITRRIIDEVRPYSVVPDQGIAATVQHTLEAIAAGVPGDLVECGTCMGGCSYAMLLAQRYALGSITRPVWMYDSFQGMSEPAALDGDHARWWIDRSRTMPVDPDGVNYCIAPLEKVRAAIASFGFEDHIVIREGWFAETLQQAKPLQIAVLRIDCDWYDPVKCVFDNLASLIPVGGRILIDDYAAWEGCAIATHEYLAAHKLPWRIRTVDGDCGAWIYREKDTW